MNLSYLFRAFSFALFFPEMREFIQRGNRLLTHLREHGSEYEAAIAIVEQVIDKLWERKLTEASELAATADGPTRLHLCDLELMSFKTELGARVSSISGLPLGTH